MPSSWAFQPKQSASGIEACGHRREGAFAVDEQVDIGAGTVVEPEKTSSRGSGVTSQPCERMTKVPRSRRENI